MAAAIRKFSRQSDGPVNDGVAVIPSDINDLVVMSRVLWVGTTGDLTVTLASGTKLTYKNAQGWMPMQVMRVWATGTTAADIVSH